MIRRGALAAFSLAVAFTASPVLAQPGDDDQEAASRLAAEGIAKFDAKDFPGALTLFQQAWAIYTGDPVLLSFMGQAAEETGNTDAAIHYYEKFLEWGPDPADAGAAQTALARLRASKAAAQRPRGFLVLSGVPKGAVVLLDGSPVTPGDRPMEVAADRHRLEVHFQGRPPMAVEVVVAPGKRSDFDVGAMLLATYPAAGLPPAKAAASEPPPAPEPSEPPPSGPSMTHAFVATALAVAAASGALYARSRFHDAAADGEEALSSVQRPAYEDAKERGESAATAFYVLGGAAAAAAGWAGYVWFTLPAGSSAALGWRTRW